MSKAQRIQPVGALSFYHSDSEKLYVQVVGVGLRRKYVDESGQVFVKAFGKSWAFPQNVEY